MPTPHENHRNNSTLRRYAYMIVRDIHTTNYKVCPPCTCTKFAPGVCRTRRVTTATKSDPCAVNVLLCATSWHLAC
jgi:hypothetical protein